MASVAADDALPPMDADIAALREQAAVSGAPPLTALEPAQARERITAGGVLCQAGPQLRVVADERVTTEGTTIPVRIYENGTSPDDEPPITLVYAHGGGWVTGDLDYADELCRFLAASGKLRVVSVDYRLAPEHPFPAGLTDVSGVVSWAAARFGTRPLLAGDSAGGNLAAAIARDRPETIAGLVLLYPVTDSDMQRPSYLDSRCSFPIGREAMDWFFRHYAPEALWDDPLISPLRGPVPAAHPPSFVVTATHDPLRDEGRAYAGKLREAGVDVTAVEFPGLVHGFLRMTAASAAARTARDEIVAEAERAALRWTTSP